MSERRQAGEWVWLAPYAGFTGEANRLKAEIQPEEDKDWSPCSLCEDPDCREWNNLWTEPDPKAGGKRHGLCHVAECQMFDEKQETPEQARPAQGESKPVAKGGDGKTQEKGSSPVRQPKVKKPLAVIDAGTQTMRCEVCKDEVPIPFGNLTWVADVCKAFDKAHRACNGHGGKTLFSKPKEG